MPEMMWTLRAKIAKVDRECWRANRDYHNLTNQLIEPASKPMPGQSPAELQKQADELFGRIQKMAAELKSLRAQEREIRKSFGLKTLPTK
jgi:hypothetical protein